MANSSLRFLLAIVTGAAGMMLAGCVNFSAIDDLKEAQPAGTAFDQALFKNYAFLARSFGDVGASSYTTFDQIGSLSLSETDSDIAGLANTFASKALQLSRGNRRPGAGHRYKVAYAARPLGAGADARARQLSQGCRPCPGRLRLLELECRRGVAGERRCAMRAFAGRDFGAARERSSQRRSRGGTDAGTKA